MSTQIPIDSMIIEDKLLAMETLWEDLCRLHQADAPPAWRRDLLKERERSLEAGTDDFMDWEDAKRAIRQRTA